MKKRSQQAVLKDPSVVLIEAARAYAHVLKLQHKASATLHRARSRGNDDKVLDQKHGAACDALDEAEHMLLVCAAVLGGWSRKRAETSV
jgi:hypothetical protein